MSENILELKNISKAFGRNRVLTNINLELKKGTVLGLMGENGAGKSTMMKILFGIYSKDDGRIFFDGKEVEFSNPKDALENGVAMVHQELNQCLDRNVVDNLFLGKYRTKFGVINEKVMREKGFWRKVAGIFIDNVPIKLLAIALAVVVFIVSNC